VGGIVLQWARRWLDKQLSPKGHTEYGRGWLWAGEQSPGNELDHWVADIQRRHAAGEAMPEFMHGALAALGKPLGAAVAEHGVSTGASTAAPSPAAPGAAVLTGPKRAALSA
jgi:hypothetical protein